MKEYVYDNFTACYEDLIKQVYNNPDFEASPRGMKVREKLGFKFVIKNPRDRIPFVPSRNFSVSYVIAELLWYFSGNNSTEWISNYSSFWKNISDDGETANSAYGARIFRSHDRIGDGDFVQWDYVVNELKNDPDSRRAVIHIRSPWDSTHAKLDVPCTLTLQFFIRDEKLHMVVNMRSSDVILGIAYDVPAFTMMQEAMANRLGVGLGEYTHISNSLHIYERHFEMAESVIGSPQEALRLYSAHGEMPPLPNDMPIERLYRIESNLRSSSNIEDINNCIIAASDMDPYWKDWVVVLASHRCSKLGLKDEKRDLLGSTFYSGYGAFRR